MYLRRDDTYGHYRIVAVILSSIMRKQITTFNLCSYNVPFVREDIANSVIYRIRVIREIWNFYEKNFI